VRQQQTVKEGAPVARDPAADAWPRFCNATDDDLRSICAFLRTVKPVTNHVPDVQFPAVAAATN
jgi:hypothetical protein